MANNFPPIPVYPKNYDSDRTLFLVYNTSETITTTDNAPWSEEISIKAVAADKLEIWADNGFANIEGELFYYDSVEKDDNGKVKKFKKCIRNLGGKPTKHNKSGAEVRGYVVAEHHNQLVDAILNIEDFIGENFTDEKETLDWRIRNLQELEVIFDDFTCPDLTFFFTIEEDSPSRGILASYDIQIDGGYNGLRLDFGDGNFVTSTTTGSYRYAPNAKVDPVVTVTTDRCTLIQTPIERNATTEPQIQEEDEVLEIKIPELPDLPPIIIPSIVLPPITVQPPPLVTPCINLGPLGNIEIPSVIIVDPPIIIPSIITFIDPPTIPSIVTFINPPSLPSLIEFGPIPTFPTIIEFGPIPTFPVLIEFGPIPEFPTTITFGPGPEFPTVISFGPAPEFPTTITFGPGPEFPTTISFGPAPEFPTTITFGPGPDIPSEITFGSGPDIPSHITFGSGPDIPSHITFGPGPDIPSHITFGSGPDIPSEITFGSAPTFDPIEFGSPPTIMVTWDTPPDCTCTVTIECPPAMAARQSLLDDPTLEVNAENMGIGIPSVIKVLPPNIPDIRIIHDIPAVVRVEPINMPKSISIDASSIPQQIKLVNEDVPSEIKLVSTDLPKSIPIDASNIPKSLTLEVGKDFPKSIKLDASEIPDKIQVVGIPKHIELVGDFPSEIKLVMPDKPEVELVYKGAPIDVKIQLDVNRLVGEGEKSQCVAIVPCAP